VVEVRLEDGFLELVREVQSESDKMELFLSANFCCCSCCWAERKERRLAEERIRGTTVNLREMAPT